MTSENAVSAILDRLDEAKRRMDQLSARIQLRNDSRLANNLGAIADRLGRQIERQEIREARDDAAERAREAEERREWSRRQAAGCHRHQIAYSDSFRSLGVQVPQPVADEAAGDYRRRLFAALAARLSPRHNLFAVDPNRLDSDAIRPCEEQLRIAIADEVRSPSIENVPDSPADPRSARTTIDPMTGQRKTEFFAKHSYIRDFLPSAKTVISRIIDPTANPPRVLWGGNFPEAR
jgi:hypothetical protein